MFVHICVQSQFNTERSGSVSRPHLGFIQLIVFLHYLVAFYRQLCNPVLWRNSVTFLIAMHILIWRKTHFYCHLCFSYEAEMEVFAPSFRLSTPHPSPHHPSAYQNICAAFEFILNCVQIYISVSWYARPCGSHSVNDCWVIVVGFTTWIQPHSRCRCSSDGLFFSWACICDVFMLQARAELSAMVYYM